MATNNPKRKSRRRDSNRKDDKSYEREAKKDLMNAPHNTNDPSWYFRDPVFKEGLTRLPTFEFRGVDTELEIPISFHSSVTSRPGTPYLKSPVMGVHYLNPSPGRSVNNTSPVNMAARMLYSKLSSSNAKTSGYAPQDVATLMLALGEIISMITYATRLYGITQYYNRLNRSIPNTFLLAHGISTDTVAEWTQDLPNFRSSLNQLITVANSISFPANIPYFKKCAYVYQNIYIDDVSEMTAYHMFAPSSTWIVDEESYEQGTILKTQTGITGRTVLGKLRRMIDAVLTSTTYNYIYSDILNLASRGVLGSDLLSFGTIPVDFVTEPIYSDQFNWQIMNATIFGEPNGENLVTEGPTAEWTTPLNDVYPDVNGNALLYFPTWNYTGPNWLYGNCNFLDPIVRVQNVNVSEDDIIEDLAYTGTPNLLMWKSDTGVNDVRIRNSIFDQGSIPDHYVVKSVIYFGNSSTTNRTDINRNAVSYSDASTALVGEFQHFPLIYAPTDVNPGSDGVFMPGSYRFYGRLGSYTLNMNNAIKNIRDASILGLFTME